jgi:hypothetical protein
MWQSLSNAPVGKPFLAFVPGLGLEPDKMHMVYRAGQHYVLQDDDITAVEPTLWMDVKMPGGA